MAEKHQKKKKGSVLKILLAVLLLLVLTVGAAGVFAYNEINGNGGKPGAEVTVSIPQGSGVAAIAKELKEAGVIRSAYLFRWYVGHKGAAGKLQYGDFTLQTGGYSYDGLIAELSTYAKADSVRLTFPEGTPPLQLPGKWRKPVCVLPRSFWKKPTPEISVSTPSGSMFRTMPMPPIAL